MVGIGFFAPFPLALMVPFMAGQSLAMGEAFGKGFQYGKRKISSMSNEEFNALDFQQLSESIHTDYKVMIPSLKRSIEESKDLQDAVFDALGKLILDIPPAILDFFAEAASRVTTTSASNLGSELQQVRLDLGQAQRREGEGGQKQGASLFDKDQLAIREKQLAAQLQAAKEALISSREEPTRAQQTTKISPTFASALTVSDLLKGGNRARSTRQGLIKWTTTHMVTLVSGQLKTFIWSNKKWTQQGSTNVVGNISQAVSIINTIKRRMGSSYVLAFSNRWFAISDGFVAGFKPR